VEIIFRKRVPVPPLSSFVKCFWYWQGAPATHSKERLMPTGEPSVIFNLGNDPIRIYDADNLGRYAEYGRSVVSGAGTTCIVIDTSQEECVFGIQFHPGGAFPFFRVPSAEMENRSVDLQDVWPGTANELRERLLCSRTIELMFDMAERYLFMQLVKPLELHRAVAFALGHFCRRPHVGKIGLVMRETGLSERRFIELFHEQVGLTPKAFCRVRRFQHVLKTVHGARELNWAQIALNSGYYDQSHFIHDFRELSGLTPTQYFARATAHLNHVPVF
jgi:AraC-like DNA-binding protein